jgi:hypothetical protein
VKLATFCYSSDRRQVLFAHYKTLHSVYLDLQYVTNVGVAFHHDVSVVRGAVSPVDFYNFGPEPAHLQVGGPWTESQLVPNQLVGPQYVTPFTNSRLNKLSVWEAVLGHGNWGKFTELLKTLSAVNVLEVSFLPWRHWIF